MFVKRGGVFAESPGAASGFTRSYHFAAVHLRKFSILRDPLSHIARCQLLLKQLNVFLADDNDDFDLVFLSPSSSVRWITTSRLTSFSACAWLRPFPETDAPVAVLSFYNSPGGTSEASSQIVFRVAVDTDRNSWVRKTILASHTKAFF